METIAGSLIIFAAVFLICYLTFWSKKEIERLRESGYPSARAGREGATGERR